jgi:ubiquinone/menaquinone biosynthesis C-methylase UbiE
MSSSLNFDEDLSRRVESTYITPDVAAQRRQLIQLLKFRPGERILDIGSGPGLLASEIGEIVGSGGYVFGVDLSPHMTAIAARRCADKPWIEFQTADAVSVPCPDGAFDVVISTQVFEYISDLTKALKEVYRVLRPGGRMLILDTDWDSLVWHSSDRMRMNRILEAWNDHCADPFLPRTLASRLRQVGFRVEKSGIIEILNTEYGEKTYSYWLIDFIAQYVSSREGIKAEEAIEWAEDLKMIGDEQRYFFSLNRYYFMGDKPYA